MGKGKNLIVSGTLLDIGGVAASDEEIEFEIWEPTLFGGKPNSVNCNPSQWWQVYRCDLGTATTDSFGNFVFNWTVPDGDEPESDDNYRLESFFRGSTYLNQQIVTNELTIMDETVNLIANLSSESGNIGESLYVNGSVADKAVDNGNIQIEVSGSELSSFDVEDSSWSSEIDIPSTLSAGNYTVIVSFD